MTTVVQYWDGEKWQHENPVQAQGKIEAPASVVEAASLNIPVGLAPDPPTIGDIWHTSDGLFYRNNAGVSVGPIGTIDESNLVHKTGTETITGDKTFTGDILSSGSSAYLYLNPSSGTNSTIIEQGTSQIRLKSNDSTGPTYGEITVGNYDVNLTASGGGTVYVNGPLSISGNLIVYGTTFTVNSTTVTVDDPTFTLGGDIAPTIDDNKDRGIEFRWHNGSVAKTGFFGYDDSTGSFTFIPDATNTSEVFSGTKGTIDAFFSGSNINAGTVSATYIDSAIARLASPTFTGTVTIPTLDLTTAATATAATSYWVETGSDGILRPKTLANVKTEVVTTAAVNAAAATTVGTITSGTWNGDVVAGQYGGTGVANTGKTITVSGNTVIGSSTHTVTFATSANTSVTLPTSGTLEVTGHTHSYQPLDADLTAIAGLAGTSGLLRKTAADTWSLDTNTYLTENQLISLSGDISGSGTTTITTTLATVNSNVGSFGSATQVATFTVNAKGLITAASNTSIQIAQSQVTSLTTDLAAKATDSLVVHLAGTETITGAKTFSMANTTAVSVRSNSSSNATPWIEVIGQRNDGNDSASFSGQIGLGAVRTDTWAASGKVVGRIAFGQPTTFGDMNTIQYAASIVGYADGIPTGASNPTGLKFYTGSTPVGINAANVTAGTLALTIDSAGAATFVSTVAASGLAGSLLSSANPLMNGTVSAGSSAIPSRQDHVHPVDTSRAASSHTHSGADINSGTVGETYIDSAIARLAGPTFTGTVTLPTGTTKVGQTTLAQGVNGTITFPASAGTLALNNQTMFIGTTSVAINRASAALTLAGITLTDGVLNNIVASASTTDADLWSEITSGSITIGSGITTGAKITLGGASASSGGQVDILAAAASSGTKTIKIGTSGTSGSTVTTTIGTVDGGASTINLYGTTNVTGKTTVTGDIESTGTVYGSSPTGFRNLLINGQFTIWQRIQNVGGVTATSTGFWGPDRWKQTITSPGTLTISRDSAISLPAAAGSNRYALKGVVGTADASLAAGDIYGLAMQQIEGIHMQHLGWGTANAKTLTLSFWVYSSVTGTYYVSIRNRASDRSYPASYAINSANTWEKKTITIPGDTTGTWPIDGNTSMTLRFVLAGGSTYQGTANTWQAGDKGLASNQTNFMATAGNTIYITNVQLEEGVVATPYEWRPPSYELELCQRYFYQVNGTTSTTYNGWGLLGAGYASATTSARIAIALPTQMRFRDTAPSFGCSNIQIGYKGAATVTSTIATGYWSPRGANGLFVDFTTSNVLTQGEAVMAYTDRADSSYFQVSVED